MSLWHTTDTLTGTRNENAFRRSIFKGGKANWETRLEDPKLDKSRSTVSGFWQQPFGW